MRKLLLHPFSILLGGVLLASLGFVAFNRYNGWREKNRTEWESKLKTAKDSVEFYKNASSKATFIYDTIAVPKYIKVRDAALADPKTPESTKKVIQACELIRSACDSVQKTLRGQVRSLETENDLLRHKPGPPRLVAYGEPLYDGIGMRPVIRTGAEFRVVGPLYLKAEAEYAVPSTLREGKGEGLRVLAGVRINFNR